MPNGKSDSSYVNKYELRKRIVNKVANSLNNMKREELLKIAKQLYSQYNNRGKSINNIRKNLQNLPNIRERLDLIKKAHNAGVNSNIVKNFKSGKITAIELKQKISNAIKKANNANAFYLTGGYGDPTASLGYKNPKPGYLPAGGGTMFPSSLVNN